ncbi:MAG: adenylosuccinate lyase [bacterium]|jgi:adenylosuccinate lyase|nr:adenylosuccinate lyase [candidate division KSB1 bacterium]MDH7561053.1 adenylosuccinate lyase [bacterium]
MIARYTRPRMGAIWSDEHRFATWLEVETVVCEVMAELGQIPLAAAQAIRSKGRFDVARISEIEQTVKHDVIAFLTNVHEYVGEEARYLHLGLTSSDLLDTSLALLLREAGKLLLEDLAALRAAVRKRALEFKHTPCIGRTHGVHAEPITFGLKLAVWYDELGRAQFRLERAVEAVSVGKISGAVGTFGYLDPRVEELVCARLGLRPAPVSTQIVQRDVHAEYLCTLALIASSLEKFAVEVRNLQRTEILEAEEYFSPGQKGSSAMPHKRNPITCERIAGMARIVRGNALAALDNMPLWHERDISHSSVERVIVPDSTIILDYMLATFTDVVERLLVYPENMLANLHKTGGLIFSQALLLALVNKGVAREEAYQWVQAHAMTAWRTGADFRRLVLDDPQVRSVLSEEEVERCFDLNHSLRHVDYIFARAGLA